MQVQYGLQLFQWHQLMMLHMIRIYIHYNYLVHRIRQALFQKSIQEVKADIVREYLKNNPDADEDNLPQAFITSMDLAPEAHADVQCIIQRWIDSSISKTVNAPKGYTVEQVEGVYERLYKGGAKGGTVYVDGSRDSQVLTLKAEDNTFEEEHTEEDTGKRPVVLIDTIQDLRSTNVTIGSEVGDTCPVCRKGTVEEMGGCNTCTNCAAQLKCGL